MRVTLSMPHRVKLISVQLGIIVMRDVIWSGAKSCSQLTMQL